jgi:alpha/beta superfamily hydrolase
VSGSVTIDHREFTASDGAMLVGDFACPTTARLGAIICHPHPQYGGNRHNNVVSALFRALPATGVAALRFDFRSEFTGGAGERLDALAAIDVVSATLPDVPIVALGYSFGAMIALGLEDDRITALGLIAPPLAMSPDIGAPGVPTLVLTPAHDQFSAPSASGPIVVGWAEHSHVSIEHRTIEMADHSLVGCTDAVADEVVTWLSR